MLKQRTMVYLAALAAVPFVANAQPATGDWELTLGGGGAMARSNANNMTANLQGSLGYYLTDQWEVGARQAFQWDNRTDAVNAATDAFVDFNFNTGGPLVPFLGAAIGLNYGDGPNDWDAGPEGGIKYYIKEKAFLFALAQYRFPFRDGALDDGNWRFALGLGLNL